MARLNRLEVTDLSLARGPRTLFRNLSFAVAAGEAVVLMGDNGAGKTSLLRAVAGLLQPADGRMLFSGADGELDAAETIRDETHSIGHADGLAGSRSARAELCFAVDWTGGSREVALRSAEQLGLSRVLDLEVRKLSAGQRRRLALIRLAAGAADPLAARRTDDSAGCRKPHVGRAIDGGASPRWRSHRRGGA